MGPVGLEPTTNPAIYAGLLFRRFRITDLRFRFLGPVGLEPTTKGL